MGARLDRLTLLATFARIVERGSISAAARDLGMSQASASRQLAQLEARIGVPLLVRTTHALSLTEQGAAVLGGGRHLLSSWDALLDDVREEDGPLSGALKVIAPVALGQLHLSQAVLAFQRAHPGVDVTWILEDAEIRFSEVGCDLWVRIGLPDDETLIARSIGEVERLVVAAPSLLGDKTLESPASLRSLPALALAPFEGEDIPLTSATGGPYRLSVDAVLKTNNIFSLHQAARQAVGFAVMPRWMVADDLLTGHLVDVLPDWRAPTLRVTACFRPVQRQSRRLRAFREAIETAIRGIEGIAPLGEPHPNAS